MRTIGFAATVVWAFAARAGEEPGERERADRLLCERALESPTTLEEAARGVASSGRVVLSARFALDEAGALVLEVLSGIRDGRVDYRLHRGAAVRALATPEEVARAARLETLLAQTSVALEEVLAGMHEVAEGVKTTRAVRELGRQLDVELPITEAVYALLYDGKTAPEMVDALMGRPLKKE